MLFRTEDVQPYRTSAEWLTAAERVWRRARIVKRSSGEHKARISMRLRPAGPLRLACICADHYKGVNVKRLRGLVGQVKEQGELFPYFG